MKIRISKLEMRKIKEFAHLRSQNVGLYKKRGGFKYIDVVTGAMAEFGVFKVIPGLSEPDLEIYKAKDKTFDADMKDGDNRMFHVKGQSKYSADKYGDSWLMQKTDPILNDPRNKNYLVLCTVDIQNEIVEIRACIPVRTIVSYNLLMLPVLPHLQDNKYALYMDEIRNTINNSQRWSILYEEIKDPTITNGSK